MTRSFISRRRVRELREYLTAYLMIAPAGILIFTFGIFPVGFALYVSLNKWRIKRGDFIGIGNYIKAIDNLAYILLFGAAIGALAGVFYLLRRIYHQAKESGEKPWLFALPAALFASTVASFIRWTVMLLPEFLDIADKIIGKEKTRELFMSLIGEAFRAERVQPAWTTFVGLTLGSLIIGFLIIRLWYSTGNLTTMLNLTVAWLAAAVGVLLLWVTFDHVATAYQIALETGEDPGIWPQVITISSGVVLLAIGWKVWNSADKQVSNRAFWLRIMATGGLLVGGWLLIGEIPVVIAAGDKDLWNGLKVTVFYSVGTVPFQLAFSLFLAILLFQKLRGSEIFRMLYFLPYVTPTVASAAIFRQLFSNRYQAPVNQLLIKLGLEPQQWVREPSGIFFMFAENFDITLPSWAAGPSMALLVIMIYSIWTFVGYNTVIYLAGLGNISQEIIDAAEIDGAGKWKIFRYIIFPLLSPTTYFLSLLAIIGTFKAFNHIWVMRQGSALGTTDTFSVAIFAEFFEKTRYGYASALAFVLFAVILSLTYVNNKIQGSRVFYG